MIRENLQSLRALLRCSGQLLRCKKRASFLVVSLGHLQGILDLRVQAERLRMAWEDVQCLRTVLLCPQQLLQIEQGRARCEVLVRRR